MVFEPVVISMLIVQNVKMICFSIFYSDSAYLVSGTIGRFVSLIFDEC